jgi:hypothetical protein
MNFEYRLRGTQGRAAKSNWITINFARDLRAAAGANTISQNIDMVTARVNYKFGAPVVARY